MKCNDCPNTVNVKWTSLPGPNGTTLNPPTGSTTPGASGALDGERNGSSGGVNDYFASDSVTGDDCLAKICGTKFNDLNANGVRDPLEPGLSLWEITAQTGSHTATTNANGDYCITVPAPATYTVSETQQTPWLQTFPVPNSHTVTPPATNINFGNCLMTEDKNGDGIPDDCPRPPCAAGPGELNVSTGTDGIGNPDPIWTLVTPSSPPAYGIAKYIPTAGPPWVDPPSGSSANWIHGGDTPGSDPQLGSGAFPSGLAPGVPYVYQTSFTAAAGSTLTIDLQYAADNWVHFDLNGPDPSLPVIIAGSGHLPSDPINFNELHPHAGVDMPAPYTLTGLASSGPYTLTAYVHNEAPGVFTPTGLLVCGTLEGDDLAYARITGPSVGGTVELLAADVSDSPASPADASGSPIALYVVLAGSIAGGALALAAGGWYSRKRWLR